MSWSKEKIKRIVEQAEWENACRYRETPVEDLTECGLDVEIDRICVALATRTASANDAGRFFLCAMALEEIKAAKAEAPKIMAKLRRRRDD